MLSCALDQEIMDSAEKIAESYLKKIFDNVIFEPNGNIPPDFIADNKIAVEVRRLNENYFKGSKVIGLEKDRIKLSNSFTKICAEFNTDFAEQCYWIILQYERPIDKIKILNKSLKVALINFLSSPSTPKTIQIGKNFSIQICKAPTQTKQKFRIGGYSDQDSAGWVHEIYTDNINHAIQEKTTKIAAHKSKYKNWWLVLVDQLEFLDEYDKPSVIKNLKKNDTWDQVLVIHPHTGSEIIKI